MNQKEQLKKEAVTHLKKFITPKTQLLIFIKKVSASGMSRQMLMGVVKKSKYDKIARFYDLTYYINDLLGYSNKKNYIQIRGCGMDMAFWLADTITYYLYKENKPKTLTGNGGGCLEWAAIY